MNFLNEPLSLSFASVVVGSFLLLLGTERPQTRQVATLVMALAAVVFSVLALWKMGRGSDIAFGAFLSASLALGNFAVVLKRNGRDVMSAPDISVIKGS